MDTDQEPYARVKALTPNKFERGELDLGFWPVGSGPDGRP